MPIKSLRRDCHSHRNKNLLGPPQASRAPDVLLLRGLHFLPLNHEKSRSHNSMLQTILPQVRLSTSPWTTCAASRSGTRRDTLRSILERGQPFSAVHTTPQGTRMKECQARNSATLRRIHPVSRRRRARAKVWWSSLRDLALAHSTKKQHLEDDEEPAATNEDGAFRRPMVPTPRKRPRAHLARARPDRGQFVCSRR